MSFSRTVEISGRQVGVGAKPYVIAEMSANHCGRLTTALEIVEASAAAGAHAVKLQHYTPETMTIDSQLADFKIKGGTLWDGRTLFDLYGDAMTPWEWTDEILEQCRRHNLDCFSTPFDKSAVDFLEYRNVSVYKIASFELVDLPLIRFVAAKKRPIIISTGMGTLREIDAAINAILDEGNDQIVVLRCNSAYPASPAEMDLATITEIPRLWPVAVGLSDHTLGSVAAIVAIALGATVFEKHITISRENGSADAAFSSEPAEFRQYVEDINTAHAALGHVRFGPSPSEISSLAFRRSLRATRPIAAGERLDFENVGSKRPAGGWAPERISEVSDFVATRNIELGEVIDDKRVRWSPRPE
jgi:pseudaminic acid synthase